jgi:hypothetical protein
MSGVHRTVYDTLDEQAALGKTQCSMAKIHRIVWWAHDQRSSLPMVDCQATATRLETLEVRNSQQWLGRTGLSGVPQGQTNPTVDSNERLTWQAPVSE